MHSSMKASLKKLSYSRYNNNNYYTLTEQMLLSEFDRCTAVPHILIGILLPLQQPVKQYAVSKVAFDQALKQMESVQGGRTSCNQLERAKHYHLCLQVKMDKLHHLQLYM